MTTSNQKKTALYCRLSQDDNTENESNSIQNQKMILQRYGNDHYFPNPCFYVDDGYSGASFQRPGFQQMMADMENGEIGIIITKDLSRLGRNQLHTGLYIEERFPMFGVRYIAINDNVDTEAVSTRLRRLANICSYPICNMLLSLTSRDFSTMWTIPSSSSKCGRWESRISV